MVLTILKTLAILIGILLAIALVIRLTHPLPSLGARSESKALSDTGDTPLGRGIAASIAANPGLSGLHLLDQGREAFAARILLARAATRSLDIQYYIWHADTSGILMLEAMRQAADRGVRVRMLLDDNGIDGMDDRLAALDAHPQVEVRLFNPFVVRRPKMIGYLADFSRLNRRMHNKSFTADNQATIIGGRNVGDEYFGARDDGLFADLDVLAIGPVVRDVSSDFDRYWASGSSYPAARILPAATPEQIAALAGQASLVERDPAARDYANAIRTLKFVDRVIAGDLPFEWARVRMVSDDPAKGLGLARDDQHLTAELSEILGTPTRDVSLVSGYFVPTAAGVDAFDRLRKSNVGVSVLTNSFAANDVWIVHAGYAHRRKAMLTSGVRLFEMKIPSDEPTPKRSVFGSGSGSGSGASGGSGQVLRSSATTLHAKTFSIDGGRVFIGSFNFDPRSMHLNTELGFVIDSRALAKAVETAFERTIPQQAYELVLTDEGDVNWIEQDDGRRIVHRTEPGTSAMQRGGIWLLSHLPIEWML